MGPLLRCTQKARKRALTLAEAEQISELAHQRHVRRRLATAVQRVEKAIAHREAVHVGSRKRAWNCGKSTAAAAAADRASKRRASMQDQQLRADKWRWLKRPDLTTAELLRGPPPQFLQLEAG